MRGWAGVRRCFFPGIAALPLFFAGPALAQDLQDRQAQPAPPSETALPKSTDQIQFSADGLEYDSNADVVTATGDVRMYRGADRLRADQVTWNRKTGQVVATGNIVVTNPSGDAAYGDSIELTDSLKDGVVDNLLVVLDQGGRLAASRGTRDNGVVTLENAAYTPCNVVDMDNCPKEPTWKITAVRVVYDPDKQRIFYKGARLNLFGIGLPLPSFSNPVGGGTHSGLLVPDIRYTRVNGFEYAQPYYFSIAPNRGLKITPRFYSNVYPMVQVEYSALTEQGAYRIAGYGTVSSRTDLLAGGPTADNVFRGYLEGTARFQLGPNWTVTGSLRVTTDRTFLRRYDISRDDLLRNSIRVERIDDKSYFAVTGWAVQTLRVGDRQNLQPVAFPEIDYRRRFDDPWLGGKLEVQLNTLAIGRSAGQDTQRGFVSARWDLRRLTPFGQEVTLTAYARGDVYNARDTAATTVALYRGLEGFQSRGIAAVAIDVKWPFVGQLFGGTQRLTPRIQIVASPKIANLIVPNEDSRAVDLEDSNLFALNRFPGYDRFGGTTRLTYGFDWALNLPDFTINANVGQSYRFSSQPDFVPVGTGFSDALSDVVGRIEVRYRDFVSITQRFRLDKDNAGIRRNEVDATIGTASTYLLLGYLLLDRNITPTLEDLRDREEARLAGRWQFTRFWSVFGSAVVDLTGRSEDPLATTNGFLPVRHRLGFAYEDDCLKLGLTWKRDYQDTGDAQRGDSFLLNLAFKNLGR